MRSGRLSVMSVTSGRGLSIRTKGMTPKLGSRTVTGNRALTGLRVVDLSTLLAAPQVAALLADLGADVVKVEPPAGDPLEGLGLQRGGRSVPYRLANRGKRRVVVDPESDAGLDALARLTARAGVVVTNQPRTLLERW